MPPSTLYRTPPPSSALSLLARAHILLHTNANIRLSTEFGAIAACGIMIYGVIPWQVAERRCRAEIVDEEEGMVLLDFDDDDDNGRGTVREREVGFVGEDGDEGCSFEGEKVEREVAELVRRACEEIKTWDQEVRGRVEVVLRGLVWEQLER